MAPARGSAPEARQSRRRPLRRARAGTRLTCALLACAALAGIDARAEDKAPELAHAVKLFKVLCLGQLPDLDGVALAAGLGEFAPASEDEMDEFGEEASDALRVWRFHDKGGEYVLTAGRAEADGEHVKDNPKLEGRTATVCALHVPPSQDARSIEASLATLFARPADRTWKDDEGPIAAWNTVAGPNFSQVRFYAPGKEGLNRILRAATFLQN